MKIVLLGDSITQGLGSKKINFVYELLNLLGNNIEIVNFAKSGTTIKYVDNIISLILEKEKPDCVISLYGNVDAQIKPNRNGKIFNKIPRRFRLCNGSMILPRPFYSRNFYKRIIQKVENILRTIFRKMIYYFDGVEQWIELNEFEMRFCKIKQTLNNCNIDFFACSTVFIDDNLFPGSNNEYIKFNKIIKKNILETYYIDIYNPLKEKIEKDGWESIYNYDHFHPNGEGYCLMAQIIAEKLKKYIESF